MAFAPLAAFAHEKGKPGEPLEPEITDTTQAQKMLEPIMKMAADLENGRATEMTSEQIDLWALADQDVELFDGTKEPNEEQTPTATYRLDKASLGRSRPAFTQLRAKIDPRTRHVVIEATVGENEKGEHGLLVARMHIRRVRDVVALSEDKGILSIMDSAGRYSALDMGWIYANAYQAPVQVERNLWQPLTPQDFSRRKVEASYITPGTRTLDGTNLYSPDVTFPADPDGNPVHKDGDLVIKVDGKLFAILNRDIAHTKIELSQAVLYALRMWDENDPRKMEELNEFLTYADQNVEGFAELLKNVENMAMDPWFAHALRAFDPKVLSSLADRAKANRAFRQTQRNQRRAVDHDKIFRELEQNAAAMGVTEDEKLRLGWKDYVTRRFQTREQQMAVVNEPPGKQRVRNLKYYAQMGSAAAGLVALMASPQLYESSEFLQRFAIFSYTYQHFPAVLKDAAYRWPLIYHTISMLAIWPASPLISGVAGGFIRTIGAAVENRRGPVSGRIRDFARTWGNMATWERIVAAGLRGYSRTMVTPVILITEKLMQQRTLLPAVRNGIKPWEKITPDSKIGQEMNLTEATRVGFNKMNVRELITVLTLGIVPNSKTNKLRAERSRDLKMELLAKIDARERANHDYTKLLAGLVVAERRGVPLEVIREAMIKKTFNLSDLRVLVENPEARRTNELVGAELRKQIGELPVALRNGGDPEVYAEHYALAEDAYERIAALPDHERFTRALKIKIRAQSLALTSYVLDHGREPANYLYNVLPSKQAWANTQREFVIDHIWVVGLPGVKGKRADLAVPQQLAADPNGVLWTNPLALGDIGSNTYVHFFTAGARWVLQHQVVKAVVETLYEPIDQVVNRVIYRDAEGQKHEDLPGTSLTDDPQYTAYLKGQAFLPGVWQFIKGLHPTHSEIGEQAKKGVRNNFDMAWAYLWMSLGFRIGLMHQTLEQSLYGLSMQWFLAPIFISVWWWVIQKGTKVYEDGFEHKREVFQSARAKLGEASRQWDEAYRDQLRKDGIWQLYQLYDESAPQAIDSRFHPLVTTATLEEQAAYWSDLADRVSPGAMTHNRAIPWLGSLIGAAGSTYTAVSPMVWSTTPELLNLPTVALAAVAWASFLGPFIFLTSKKTWDERIPRWTLKIKQTFARSCQDTLTTR